MSDLTEGEKILLDWFKKTPPGWQFVQVKELDEIGRILDKFVHAYEDSIDDYDSLKSACDEAKKHLPDYKPKVR